MVFLVIYYVSPHCLVLDEPTNHLDVETVEALGYALQNFTVCIFKLINSYSYSVICFSFSFSKYCSFYFCREVLFWYLMMNN